MPEKLRVNNYTINRSGAGPVLLALLAILTCNCTMLSSARAAEPTAQAKSSSAKTTDNTGSQEQSIPALVEYIRTHPLDEQARLALANNYLLAKDYNQALATAQLAGFFNHASYPALQMQAEINLQLNRLAEARELGIHLAVAEPKNHFAYLLLAKLGGKDKQFTGESEWSLQLAKANAAGDCQLFCDLGKIFLDQSEQSAKNSQAQEHFSSLAQSAYKSALTAKSNDFTANLGLAKTLVLRDDAGQALTYAQKAKQIEPANTEAQAVADQASKDKNNWGLQISHLFRGLIAPQ